jgi:ribosomal RNA-processing protein 8
LSTYPPRTVIADLGCGDAALARALIPKGYTVISFDLVGDGALVVEADIFDRLPLPGSEADSDGSEESSQGHAQIVNVVVCALSLMGTNWPNCIREAWRILRPKYVLSLITDCLNIPSLTPLDQWRTEDRRGGQSLYGCSTISVVC